MTQRSTLFRTSAVAAAAASIAGLGQAVAAAQPGAQYVALGSSYAAGPGITPVIDTGCARSERNYAHQVAAVTGLALVDVTCSGATTEHVLDTKQRLLDGRSLPVQLDAVTSDTELVTVTIGGNDLRLVGSMTAQSCGNAVAQAFSLPSAADPTARLCAPGAEAPAPDTDYDRVEQSLVRIAERIHTQASRARVLFVAYLPVLDIAARTCPAVPLQPEQASAARTTYDGLLAATARAARATGADLVQVPDRTHTVCAPAPWVTGFANPFTGKPDLPALLSSYHPNLDGMTAVAQEITARLD